MNGLINVDSSNYVANSAYDFQLQALTLFAEPVYRKVQIKQYGLSAEQCNKGGSSGTGGSGTSGTGASSTCVSNSLTATS